MDAHKQTITDNADFNPWWDMFPQLDHPEIGENLSLRTEDGVAILTGSVKTPAEKKAAEEAAMQTYGVKAVASNIDVKPDPERTDTEIAKDILRAFQSNICIPADEVMAIVSKGRIRLEGTVCSEFQKLIAEGVVKSLRGITSILNNIQVRPEPLSSPTHREIEAVSPWPEPQEIVGVCGKEDDVVCAE